MSTPLRVAHDYVLRPVEPDDEATIARWISADDDHRGRVAPGFFMERGKGTDSMMLVGAGGEDIFALRIDRVARLHIQFPPTPTEQDRERLRAALTEGCEWLAGALSSVGIRELIFESRVARLIAFCRRRLGFRRSPDELVRVIVHPGAASASEANSGPGKGL